MKTFFVVLALIALSPLVAASSTLGGNCSNDAVHAGTWDYYSYEVWGNEQYQVGVYSACEGSSGASTGVAARYEFVGVYVVVSPGNLHKPLT